MKDILQNNQMSIIKLLVYRNKNNEIKEIWVYQC